MQQINNHIAKLLFYFISSIWLFSISTLFSQEIGSWNTLNIRYTIDEKLTLNGEGQIRSLNFYNTFHYFEYKTWVNYKFLPNAIVSLGIGNYQTFNENGNFRLPKNNNEIRIWPQLTLNQKLGALNIEQRYRVESRFTTNGYRNRFRYRFGVSYPFGSEKKGFKPYQISASNELFFTNKEPYFERNRIQFALGFKPTKSVQIQLGYLHQFDYKINDETGRDFLLLGFYYEIFRNQTESNTLTPDLKDN